MKQFIKNWVEVIVAVTFLVTGVGVFWAVSDTSGGTEMKVTATEFKPETVESNRSIASDESEVTETPDNNEAAETTDGDAAAKPAPDSEK